MGGRFEASDPSLFSRGELPGLKVVEGFGVPRQRDRASENQQEARDLALLGKPAFFVVWDACARAADGNEQSDGDSGEHRQPIAHAGNRRAKRERLHEINEEAGKDAEREHHQEGARVLQLSTVGGVEQRYGAHYSLRGLRRLRRRLRLLRRRPERSPSESGDVGLSLSLMRASSSSAETLRCSAMASRTHKAGAEQPRSHRDTVSDSTPTAAAKFCCVHPIMRRRRANARRRRRCFRVDRFGLLTRGDLSGDVIAFPFPSRGKQKGHRRVAALRRPALVCYGPDTHAPGRKMCCQTVECPPTSTGGATLPTVKIYTDRKTSGQSFSVDRCVFSGMRRLSCCFSSVFGW